MGGFAVAKRHRSEPSEMGQIEPTNIVMPEDHFFQPRLLDSTYQE